MTTPPLSTAAQAVLEAHAKARCQREWSTVNDPPCHPSDPEWNGCGICVDRVGPAAAIRALVEQVAPETLPAGLCDPELQSFVEVINRTFRTKLQSIAAELDGGAGQHTTQPTETASDSER
jgi:hypothetical protein